MTIPKEIATERQPGSPGGMTETVKRAFIVALREVLTGISLSDENNSVKVDMEYPLEKTEYPAIFVQFSFRQLRPSGVDPLIYKGEKGAMVKEWHFEGSVTLQIFALTSLERDRISDSFIEEFAFADRDDSEALMVPSPDDRKISLVQALSDNPYVCMTVDQGQLKPGGQSTTVGVPWDDNQLCYEDRFSFDIVGDFQSIRRPGGEYILRRIDIVPEVADRSRYEWQ